MKNPSLLKSCIVLSLLFICNTIYADESFTVNGITYQLTSTTSVAVEKMDVPHDGHVVFPSEISYRGRTFIVDQIGVNGSYSIFNNPEELISMVIPATVTDFGASDTYYGYSKYFTNCVNLKKIVIEDSDSFISFRDSGDRRRSMFYNCPLEEVYIGRNIRYSYYIELPTESKFASPFKKQMGLKKVTIGDKVTELFYGMFMSCTGLEKIDIPKNIQVIHYAAFSDCSSLSNVVLHEGLLSIEDDAFCYAPISSVTLPNSIVKLGEGCMAGNKLKTLIINDNIKEIPNRAFNSSTLTKVVIGKAVKKIGISVFGNSSIEELECRMQNPEDCSVYNSWEEETFALNNYTWTILYVPYGTIEKYKATWPWRNFVSIVEGSPSGVEQVNTNDIYIQSEGGVFIVQNVKNDTPVSVYNANGIQVGSTICKGGYATINTYLLHGSIAFVKIGAKIFKVLVE